MTPAHAAIFAAAADPDGGNLQISAVAGAGKTSTLVELMRRLQGRAPGKAWVYYVDSGELAETDISPERTADVLKHAAETIDTLRNEPMPDAMEVYLK